MHQLKNRFTKLLRKVRAVPRRLAHLAVLLLIIVGALSQTASVDAHYLNMTQAWALMDKTTLDMIAARAAINDLPLIRAGDNLTLIMKAFPSDGTTFGAGGYMTFYIPEGTQVTDVGYVYPDGTGNYVKIPVKSPSPADDNAGDRGPDTIPQLIGVTYGPNALGRSELAVTAGGVTRGTLAGVMGDTGIFYSTDPRTSWDSWYQNIGTARTYCTNPAGDCRVASQTNGLTRPSTAWDAMQILAYGSDDVGADVSLPFTTNGPLIDPSGHGSTAWGLANAVAGPQSGYMQEFNLDIWNGTRSNANFQASLAGVGPWNRIQYPGSTISNDRTDPTNALAVSVADASQLGRDIVADPLPQTLSHTDTTSPKAIRVSVGGIEQGRFEYIMVKLNVKESPGSSNPNPYDANGCFEAHAGAFAGDAGYTDNNKDHIYRYIKVSTVTFNPCTMLIKRASVASAKTGDSFSYSVQFVNSGGLTIPSFIITDPVPSGLTINSVVSEYIDASTLTTTTGFHTISGQTITWNLATPAPAGVASGDVFRATINVTATTNGPFVNTVSTNSTIPPFTERVEGPLSSIVVLDKSSDLSTVAPGGTVRYTVFARNLGSAPTSAGQPILIEDFLPADFTYAGNPVATLNGSSTSVVVGGTANDPTFTVTGQIAANNQLAISFDVLVPETTPTDTYANTAHATYQDPAKGEQFITCYGCAPVFVAGASIGDTIYRDWNGNGTQDPGEEGLAGVTVTLRDAGNNIIDTAVTDANGNYLFGGLAAGTYTVEVGSGIPLGYNLTDDPVGGLDGTATITLATNEERDDIDFGYQPGGTGVIGNLVWHDDDRGGTQNGGEQGIPGVTVNLYEDSNNNGVIDSDDLLVATTVSGAGGAYSFTGLPTDVNFIVDVDAFDSDLTAFFGTGAYDSFSADPYDVPGTLAALGGTHNNADFGFDVLTPAVIGDQLFIDNNNNGVYDVGTDDPLPNVTVNLYSDTNGNGLLDPGEPIVRTAVSDVDGLYSFDDLPPGDYIVDVVNTDPDIPGGYFAARDEIPVTGLAEGQVVNTADFPFVPLIAKSVDLAEADPGDRLTYTIGLNYPGTLLLENVIVTDTVPAGTTFVGGSVSGGLDSGTPGFSAGSSGSLTRDAVKDTYILIGNPIRNYGVTQELIVRRDGDGNPDARALFEWDVSSLPDGARIDTAAFSFYVTGSQSQVNRLYRVTTEWTEGAGDNNDCTGSGIGGATWNAPNCTAPNWTTAGGDFAATELGNFTDAANDTRYTVASNANTVAAVQVWADNDANNHGIIVRKTGTENNDTKLASAENPVNQPARLALTWSLPNRGSTLSATPVDLAPAPGGTIQLSLVLTSSFTVNNVTPSAPTYLSNSGSCTLTSAATQNVGPGGTTWTWNCTPSGTGVAQFSVDATAGGLTFPETTSNPIVVANNGSGQVIFWALGSNDAAVDGLRPGLGYCPGTLTLTASADTYVNQNAPTSNFGTLAEWFTRNNTTQRNTALIQFPVSNSTLPAGAVFQSAAVLFTNNDDNANRTVSLHAMTRAWTETGATWNTAGSGSWTGATFSSSDYSATSLGTIVPNPQQQWTIAGTALNTVVNGWVTGGTNNGFALVGIGSDTGTIGWDSREATVVTDRPQLVLNYLAPQIGDCQGDTDITADDTYVRQNEPLRNYGTDDVLELQNNTGDMRHALLNFNLNLLPADAQINLAALEFRVKSGSSRLTGTVHPLNVSWTEGTQNNATCITTGATWNAPNCTDNWLGGAFSATAYGASLGNFTPSVNDSDQYVDVTSTVQGWRSNPATNRGLVLLAGGTVSGDTVEIYSSENTGGDPVPYLEIIWAVPAAPASNVAISAGPTLVSNGAQVTIEMVLSNLSEGKPITAVTPSSLTAVTTSGDAVASSCSSPNPAGPFAVLENAPVTVTYTCTVSGATEPSEIVFRATATGTANYNAGLPYTFYTGTSNSVIVAPNLTFQADVNTPAEVTQVENTAFVRDFSGTISSTPSEMALTLIGEPAVIGNRIWVDEDGDGTQDAGEPGIAGATVELYAAGDTPGVDTPIATTTTDANGGYLFSDVVAGTYTVYVDPASLPAGLAANPTYDENGIGTPHTTSVTVVDGEEHLTADFGYNWAPPSATDNPGPATTGAIGDRIWLDADGDGVQDPGEAGIGGVTVELLTDDNGDGIYGGAGDNPATTTTTNPDGTYIFDGVAPGSYVINIPTPPAGTQTGDPDGTLDNQSDPIVLAPGDVYLNGDFGYQPTAGSTIGDVIFIDPNGNGTQDAGEPGIPGVTVALLDDNGDVIATTVTDEDGNYSFPGLPAGDYTVVVTDTNNVLGELDPISDADGAGPSPNQSTTTVDGINDNLTQDFGYAPTFHDPGEGLIGDTVFLDRNGNSTPDTGEGLEGVTVELLDAGNNVIATTTTDENGSYFFGGLDDTATYTVRVDTATLPAGLTNSVDPDGGTANQSTVNLNSDPDGVDLDQDFGYTASTPGNVAGTIWNDSDADGTLDGTEPGRYQGVTVVLLDPNGNIVAQTTTDANGNYAFNNVPPGSYTVDVTDDNNVLDGTWHSTGADSEPDPAPVTVTAGNTADADFGYYKEPAALGNFVWADDGDGVQQPSEPGIAGVEVTLVINYPNGASTTIVTTTDGNGAYSFPNLLLDEDFDGAGAGEPTYTLTVATPAGTSVTTLGAGSAATDSNNPAGTTATVTQGATNDTYDFGFVANGSIGDRLWVDEDGDGVQDAGEAGIPNALIELYAAGDTPGVDAPLATTVSGLDGGYIFKDVPPGNYIVYVDPATLPAGLAAHPTYDQDNGTTNPDGTTPVTVASGEEIDDIDFGYNWVDPTDSTNPPQGATGAIGDRIWLDADGDGVQDPGEAGIGGVTVELLTDDNGDGVYGGAGDNPATTTTTDPDGTYIFDGIAPGAYVVNIPTPPAGTQTGDPDATLDNQSEPILLAPGDVYVNADFGYQPATGSTIGDTVYVDANGDGTQNAGEPGIPGVTVNLIDNGGNVIATDVTDENGEYSFPDLPAGSYTVVVSDTANVLGELAPISDADGPGTPNESSVTVDGTTDNLLQDFGYAPDGHTGSDGLIGDTVFLDSNDDGVLSDGEGVEGVTVELYDAAGTTLLATTTTDENGNYFFGGLDPNGTYTVKVDPTTLPNGGAGLTNSIDPDGGSDSEAVVDLSSSGGVNFDQDFGYDDPAGTATGAVTGTLWNDADADGTLDGTEPGRYEGVTVVLRDPDGNIVAQTETDANGDYTFDNVPPGSYTVDVTDDNNVLDGAWHSLGTPNTDGESQPDPAPVTVTAGNTANADFGYYSASGGVGNVVWDDTDGDGVLDGGESGVPGVPVTLIVTYPNGDVVEMTTVTDANGVYSFPSVLLDEQFDGVGAGEPTFSIEIDLPANTVSTYDGNPDATGAGTGTDNNADNSLGEAAYPTQAADDDTNDFGLLAAPQGVDYGDLPATYAGTTGAGAAAHVLVSSGQIYLGGSAPDPEADGQPNINATGDLGDEDGIVATDLNVNDGNIRFDVPIGGGGGVLAGWFDLNADGVFGPNEFYSVNVPTAGLFQWTITLPNGTPVNNTQPLFARFRLFTSASAAPGGSLDAGDFQGVAVNGEVEDYQFASATAITLSGLQTAAAPTQLTLVLLAALTLLLVTVRVRRQLLLRPTGDRSARKRR